MKKISYLFFCFALLAAPLFVSCDDETLTGEFSSTPDGSDDEDDGDVTTEACAISLTAQSVAQGVYVSATEANYSTACNDYANALDASIMICGDADGSLLDALLALGDCSTVNLCAQAQAAADLARVNFENAEVDSQELLCVAYAAALENQIAQCGDPLGNIQGAINALPCDNDCENAQEVVAETQAIFEAVDVTNAGEYMQACSAYRVALQNQITACGDEDGSLLSIIADLGDCEAPEQPGPLQMMVDGELKNFNTSTVSVSGTTLNVLATDIDTEDTFFFRIVLNQTGTNVMQDILFIMDEVQHTAVLDGANPFTNEVAVNENGILQGTFTGEVTDGDGNIVVLSVGTFDITY